MATKKKFPKKVSKKKEVSPREVVVNPTAVINYLAERDGDVPPCTCTGCPHLTAAEKCRLSIEQPFKMSDGTLLPKCTPDLWVGLLTNLSLKNIKLPVEFSTVVQWVYRLRHRLTPQTMKKLSKMESLKASNNTRFELLIRTLLRK